MIENSNCLDRAITVHGALEWRKPYFRAAIKVSDAARFQHLNGTQTDA